MTKANRIRFRLARAAFACVALCFAVPSRAAIEYWDSDGTTAGLGSTAGTWGTSAFIVAPSNGQLRTALLGNIAASATANLTTSSDSIWFGTDNLGLTGAATTIGTSGTLTVNNITFGAGQTSAVTLSAGGTITLAGGAPGITVNNTTDTIGAVVAGTVGMVKSGAGTLTLTNANTYTGGTTISNGGTLQVGDGTNGSLASNALTFNSGGGVFNVQEAAGSTQALGTLTFAAGEGTVQSTYAGSGTSALSFSSLAARAAGATGNLVTSGGANGTTNTISLTGATAGTLLDKGLFFNGSSYAAYDTSGFVRALNYGVDADTAPADTITAGNHVQLTASPASRVGDTLLSLNLAGSGVNYTMSSGTLTVPGILKSGGGVSTISGGTAVTSGTGVELVIRTDNSADVLNISSPVTGTGALTKSGAGTLALSGANTYSGQTTINAGTLAVSGGNAIADAGAVVVADAPGATFRLDANETIGNLSGGSGFASGTVDVQGNTLTLGGDNSSKTFAGTLAGTMAGGIIKNGAGTLTLSNTNTFAGTFTLNGGAVQLTAISLGVPTATANYSVSSGGAFILANGTSLILAPSSPGTFAAQGQLIAPNGLAFSNAISVSSGTATVKFPSSNGDRFVLSGGVTGGTSGAQTLAVVAGVSGSSDIQADLFSGVIANGSGGTLGLSVDFAGGTSTGQSLYVSLSNQNTFTGPISVTNSRGLTGAGSSGGYLTIGGDRTTLGLAAGSGALGWNGTSGNYTNTISLATGTILDYASSANQTLGGAISGGGQLLKEGSGTLTLSGANTYSGATTVSAGTLQLTGASALSATTPLVIGPSTTLRIRDDSATIDHTTNTVTVSASGTMTVDVGNNGGGTAGSTVAFGALSNGTPANSLNSTINFTASNGYLQSYTSLNLSGGTGYATALNPTSTSVTITGNVINQETSFGGHYDTLTLDGTSNGNFINGGISDSSGYTSVGNGDTRITKSNSSTWTLAGSNTYSGVTTINGGTLQFAKEVSLYNNNVAKWTKVNLPVASGATIAFNVGGTGEFTASDVTTLLTNLDGTVSNNSLAAGANIGFDTTNASGSTFTISNGIANTTGVGLRKLGTNTLILSGPNTYSGNTTVSGGTLQLAGANALSATTSLVIGPSTTLRIRDDTAGTINHTANGVTVSAAGTMTIDVGNNGGATTGSTVALGALSNGTTANALNSTINFTGANGYLQSYTSLNLSGGTGYATALNPTSTSVTIAGNVSNQETGTFSGHYDTLTLDGTSGGNFINGAISDAAGFGGTVGNGDTRITKSNSSTWTLAGSNTYSGVTSINGGTLQFAKAVSLYNNNVAKWTAANLPVASGAKVAFNVGGAGEFTASDVTTLLTNLDGAVNNNGLRAGASIGFDTTNAAGSTFTISSGIANTTGTGGGAVGLTKLGTNTLILSGANTYTGGTTITGGTLVANTAGPDSATGMGTVTIDSGGTLAGVGKVGGGILVNPGGTITAGSGATASDAPGTLTSAGAQTWTGGATAAAAGAYNWKLGDASGVAGTGWDVLVMPSLAVATSGGQFHLVIVPSAQSNFDPNGTYTWIVADVTGGNAAIAAGNAANPTLAQAFVLDTSGLPAPAANFSIGTQPDVSFSGGEDIVITYGSVPEPGSLLLLGLGVGGLAMRRHPRTRR